MVDGATTRVQPGDMANTNDTLDRLQTAQKAEWEEAQRQEEEHRARHPDAGTWSAPLEPMLAEWDPSPAEQQEWVDRYRQEHPEARERVATMPGSSSFYSEVLDARDRWRREVAGKRWTEMLDRRVTVYCQVCGRRGGEVVRVGAHPVGVCARCSPSVLGAVAEHVANEPVGQEGLSRRQAAANLVGQLLGVTS